jgi:hypothetical protein
MTDPATIDQLALRIAGKAAEARRLAQEADAASDAWSSALQRQSDAQEELDRLVDTYTAALEL